MHFGDLKIPNLMGTYCTQDEEWPKPCIGSLRAKQGQFFFVVVFGTFRPLMLDCQER